MSYATSHIHDYSVKFYKTLEEETGLNAGFYVVGNLRMAQTQARMDEYMLYASTAETVGIPYEWLTPGRDQGALAAGADRGSEGRDLSPDRWLHQPRRCDHGDGQGRAAAGRGDRTQMAGRRLSLDRDHWDVTCTKMVEKGGNLVPSDEQVVITAEHVVTATGNHAQRTAQLLGIKMPAIPVEHQYIVTEPDPALVEWRKAATPSTRCCAMPTPSGTCARNAAAGSLAPTSGARPRGSNTRARQFRADLFPLDLERIEEEYMSMIHRIPSRKPWV
jgi:dimethylglycine dehydrogenase